jgi:hypothetical protein
MPTGDDNVVGGAIVAVTLSLGLRSSRVGRLSLADPMQRARSLRLESQGRCASNL